MFDQQAGQGGKRQPERRRAARRQQHQRERRQHGADFAEHAADGEARIVDGLDGQIGVLAEPQLAGQFEGVRQRQAHADGGQDDGHDLESQYHDQPTARPRPWLPPTRADSRLAGLGACECAESGKTLDRDSL